MRTGIKPILALVVYAVIFAGACGGNEEPETKPTEPVYFPVPDACTYTQAGPGKVFSRLGGGTWGQANPGEPRSDFECVGSTRQIQLLNSDGAVIEVEYVATGAEKGASLISITYTATGSGAVPNETTWRNAFANLVEAVSKQGLGAPPPELFRRKLSNLSSYSQPGKGLTENFDVGSGFISLTRESASASNIKVYVKLFPDISLKIDG